MTRHECDGENEWCDDCEAREKAKGRVQAPPKCGRDWCPSEGMHLFGSYGNGVTYWRCRLFHVTPEPPPPNLHALDDLADDDD